jgi:hypothetical protein
MKKGNAYKYGYKASRQGNPYGIASDTGTSTAKAND